MKDKLHAALKALGVETLSCQYSGYGDSGSMDDPDTIPPRDLNVPFDSGRSLSAALQDYFYEILGAKHGGFENNDGGQGEFYWIIAANILRLEHGDNYVQTEEYSYEI